MSRYSRGQHAVPRTPKGAHSLVRDSLGAHGIARPASWYIKREAGKRSMPALAVLLSSSMGLASLSVPLRAVADDIFNGASASHEIECAPEDATLIFDEQTGFLVDIDTGKVYDSETRVLLDVELAPDALDFLRAQALDDADLVAPDVIDVISPDGVQGALDTLDDVDIDEFISEPDDIEPPVVFDTPAALPDSVSADQESTANVPASDSIAIEDLEQPLGSSVDEFASVVDDGTTLDATVTELQVAVRLLNAGWTSEMIAAALGNMYAESGSNAASFCDMSGMFNYAYEVAGGLFQWTDAGANAASLDAAGFTGLRQFASEQGADWTDAGVQTDYFLKTWRGEWADRQTYYDATHPDFAGVDVSLAAFDESLGSDFDGDGVIDAWDDDIDGDDIPNADDPVTMRFEGEEMVYGKAAGASCILPMPVANRSEEETRRHIEELTFAFMAGYEGPAAQVAHFDRRVAHALRVYPAIVALDTSRAEGILDTRAGMIVAGAESMLGGSYVWGAESPSTKTFDCSGLTKWCYSLAGIGIEHYSETQYLQASTVVDVAQAVVGDILWRPGHVGIYIGNGRCVEAKGVNYGIVYGNAASFTSALHFDAIDQPIR